MAHAVVKTTAPSPDGSELRPETHIIKRQATRHDCLPIWLGDGEKRIAIVYGKEKNVLLGRQEQPRKDKNLLYWLDKPEGPTKEGPLSFVLLESPFVSFSGATPL
jgi:hypothetical protein